MRLGFFGKELRIALNCTTGLTSSAELGINHQPIFGSSDYFVIIELSV